MIACTENKVKTSEEKMDKIKIATDSTADIPKSFCEELNISVLLEAMKSDFLNTQAQCREMNLGENVNINFRCRILDGILRIFAPLC